MIRLRLAQRAFDAALDAATSLLQAVDEVGWDGAGLEVRILQALAWQGVGEKERALDVLRPALSLAESEGYVRIFVDEFIAVSTVKSHVNNIYGKMNVSNRAGAVARAIEKRDVRR